MDGPATGIIAFVFLFSCVLAGVVVQGRLAPAVLSRDGRAAVGASMTCIGVLSAILLALLTYGAAGQFTTARSDVDQLASRFIELDHALRQAGPEAEPARALLFRCGVRTLTDVWPETVTWAPTDSATSLELLDTLENAVGALHKAAPGQRAAVARATNLVHGLSDTLRTLGAEQGPSVSPWLTLMLLFWLMLTFAGLGLVTPGTRLALAALSLTAIAAASGVFLMVEYASPFVGTIIVSSEPLQNALFVISGEG